MALSSRVDMSEPKNDWRWALRALAIGLAGSVGIRAQLSRVDTSLGKILAPFAKATARGV